MLSDLAIRRPVLAAVASLLIIVLGLGALGQLPVRELPDIDNAVVAVRTQYTGAAPEIVDTDITEVIEGAIAGVAGVKTISSQSRRGQSNVTVEFEVGESIDEGASDVRDAVARVRAELPDDVGEPRVLKSDADADPVMRLAVVSRTMTAAQITDYVDRYVVDRLSTVSGVASIDVYGDRPMAVRIWLDRRAMAARNLTVADIESALARANLELPAGDIESASRQLTVRLNSRLPDVDAFADIVVDRVAGHSIRLRDLARVVAGVADDSSIVRSNGGTAIGLAVIRQSQSNTNAISRAVRVEVAAMTDGLPPGMAIEVGSDDALFVAASIREVVTALGISLVLVICVILVFLRSWRATLIPAITIPMALIAAGTVHLAAFWRGEGASPRVRWPCAGSFTRRNHCMKSLITAVALFAAVWLPGTTLAHHGWRWTDDGNVDLTGVIRTVRLGNPHGVLGIDIEGELWALEVGQPWRNERAGLKPGDLAEGVELRAIGQPAADIKDRRMKVERLYLGDREYLLYPDRD